MEHPRISHDPAVMGGKACIAGTRVPVDVVIGYLASGDTIEEVLEGYPDLAREDVLAALAYAADVLGSEGIVAA